jgi:hypothetical protein
MALSSFCVKINMIMSKMSTFRLLYTVVSKKFETPVIILKKILCTKESRHFKIYLALELSVFNKKYLFKILYNQKSNNQVMKLTTREKKNPLLYLEHFFEKYSLTDMRLFLREQYTGLLLENDPRSAVKNNIYGELEALVEAVWLLYKNQSAEDSKNNKE